MTEVQTTLILTFISAWFRWNSPPPYCSIHNILADERLTHCVRTAPLGRTSQGRSLWIWRRSARKESKEWTKDKYCIGWLMWISEVHELQEAASSACAHHSSLEISEIEIHIESLPWPPRISSCKHWCLYHVRIFESGGQTLQTQWCMLLAWMTMQSEGCVRRSQDPARSSRDCCVVVYKKNLCGISCHCRL